MKNKFRDFFYFSSGQRRGILVLFLLIIAAIATVPLYRKYRTRHHPTIGQDSLTEAYETFSATFQDSSRKSNRYGTKKKDFRKFSPKAVVLTPFPFDPNVADSALLTQLGFPWWMARNIVRYREKGGKFRRPEDFRKIYGLTEGQFDTLRPFIRIAPEKTDTMPRLLVKEKTDTLTRPLKYPAGTVIELNRADTTELKKIPGIGSGIARLITGYRRKLGGFYRIEQLGEINLDYEQLRPWFRIDTTAIRRLNLNRAGIERLRRHPYLNFYQAKAFVEWRKKHGRLTSLKPFLLYEEFTEDDFKRLRPYVCFD